MGGQDAGIHIKLPQCILFRDRFQVCAEETYLPNVRPCPYLYFGRQHHTSRTMIINFAELPSVVHTKKPFVSIPRISLHNCAYDRID